MWLVIICAAIFLVALVSLMFAAAALRRARVAKHSNEIPLWDLRGEPGPPPLPIATRDVEPARPIAPECLKRLDERYARGEIERPEYLRRRRQMLADIGMLGAAIRV